MLHNKAKKLVPKRLQALALLAMLLTLVVGNLPTVYAAGPTVAVTSPTNNTVHQGMVNLTATAGVGTLGVKFKITGPNLSKEFIEDTIPPYSVSWNSAEVLLLPPMMALNKHDYTIKAEARGVGGTTISAGVKVKLNNPPLPGTVMVVGDSVTRQAFDPNADGTRTYTASAPSAANRNVFADLGWSVPNVQGTVDGYAQYRWPQKLVVAMGLNDSGVFFSDGWTSTDLENFRTLFNTVHADTCIAVVLPGHGETGATTVFEAWVPEIAEARVALAQLAAERPHTITIDWQTVIDQHPEYVDEDGIHLLTPDHTPQEDLDKGALGQINPVDPAAAEARQEFYWNGAAQCTS